MTRLLIYSYIAHPMYSGQSEVYANHSCNYHVWAQRHICRCLARDAANSIACSIVGTRMDYCNCLLYGATEKSLDRLQRVQNKLARFVNNIGTRDHLVVDLL